MNASQAIKAAKRRVSMHRFGNQWVVNVYDAERRAWWQGNPTEWDRAKGAYREDLIREALDEMGVDEADYHASVLCEQDGKWESLVRGFVQQANNMRGES